MREDSRWHCLVNPVTGREAVFADRPVALSGKRIGVIGAGPAGLSYAALMGAVNQVTVFERDSTAGGAFRWAGYAPRFQNVEANTASLRNYVDTLVRECAQAGVRIVYGWKPSEDDLKSFDHVVIATGAAYRLGLGSLARRLLQMRAFRLPLLKRTTEHPGVRRWFYANARKSAVPALGLPKHATVVRIGEARRPGKSDAAIRDAYREAFGLDEL